MVEEPPQAWGLALLGVGTASLTHSPTKKNGAITDVIGLAKWNSTRIIPDKEGFFLQSFP
jgi:hypothetical protein